MQAQTSCAKGEGMSDIGQQGTRLTFERLQYLDPIMAATYSEDGSLRDVCAALAVRLRDPSVVVSMHWPWGEQRLKRYRSCIKLFLCFIR